MNENMHIDATGEDYIKGAEDAGGKPRLIAYNDGTGRYTGPWGVTHGVQPGQHFTLEQAQVMFEAEIADVEAGLRKWLKREVSQGLWNALDSFGYNNGWGKCDTLKKAVNSGDDAKIRAAFMLFTHAYDEKLGKTVEWPGLVHRRQSELALWYKTDHDPNHVIAQPSMPLPMPTGPATTPPKPNIIATAASSRSVWAHIVSVSAIVLGVLTNGFNNAVTHIQTLVDQGPAITHEVQGNLDVAAQVAGWFHWNMQTISISLTILSIGFALVRRILDKREQIL